MPDASAAISDDVVALNGDGLTPALRHGEPTRFSVAMHDGTRLVARRWDGPAGKPTLVLCDGLGCDGYTWPYVLRRFAGSYPIVHVQWRGHGESDVPADIDTVRLRIIVDDLSRVLSLFDIQDVVLLGHSMGVPISLEAWRAQRERGFSARVIGLALMCGVFENPIKTWHGPYADHAMTPLANVVMNALFDRATMSVIGRWQQMKGSWQRLVNSDFAYNATVKGELNAAYIVEDDFRPYLEHLGRMDMRVFARLVRDMREHSALDVLPTIDAPTLVVGGARDKFAPPWISEVMHHQIRGSELLMLVEGSHAAPIEQPRLVERALVRLLARIA